MADIGAYAFGLGAGNDLPAFHVFALTGDGDVVRIFVDESDVATTIGTFGMTLDVVATSSGIPPTTSCTRPASRTGGRRTRC